MNGTDQEPLEATFNADHAVRITLWRIGLAPRPTSIPMRSEPTSVLANVGALAVETLGAVIALILSVIFAVLVVCCGTVLLLATSDVTLNDGLQLGPALFLMSIFAGAMALSGE